MRGIRNVRDVHHRRRQHRQRPHRAARVGDQEVIKFRVASNSRRRTADGTWEPGNSLFVTVNCWGRLVTGVGAALRKGDPVIVVGHVYTSEYEDSDGNRRSSLEMRATSVGPDLSRWIVRIIEKTGAARDAAQLRTTRGRDRNPTAQPRTTRPSATRRYLCPRSQLRQLWSALPTWPRLRWSAGITKPRERQHHGNGRIHLFDAEGPQGARRQGDP